MLFITWCVLLLSSFSKFQEVYRLLKLKKYENIPFTFKIFNRNLLLKYRNIGNVQRLSNYNNVLHMIIDPRLLNIHIMYQDKINVIYLQIQNLLNAMQDFMTGIVENFIRSKRWVRVFINLVQSFYTVPQNKLLPLLEHCGVKRIMWK